jgi:XFP C-terminal domain
MSREHRGAASTGRTAYRRSSRGRESQRPDCLSPGRAEGSGPRSFRFTSELAILNHVDRFNLVIDVIDRVPRLQSKAAHLKEEMKNEVILNLSYAHENGTDRPEITDWIWLY